MKRVSMLVSTGATSVLLAGLVAAPAYAWHPQGAITKYVTNQTAGGTMSDANNAASAVSARLGDVLVYTVVVANNGAPASNGDDDMAKTVMTDTLPNGIELMANSTQRTITENLGTIKPGQKVTKTYSVKVTDNTDGDVITNKACFTGNSLVNDNPQSGCDVAVVKVTVPSVTPPVTPTTPEQPTTLPNTGSTSFSAAAVVLLGLVAGYAVNTLRLKRRA